MRSWPSLVALLLLATPFAPAVHAQPSAPAAKTIEVPFTSHDARPMFGKLTLPDAGAPQAVVIYVQTAEGSTVDMKRPLGGGKTFN